MIFLGTVLLGGYQSTPCTATDVSDINYMQLQNGMYDDLYVSSDSNMEISSVVPSDWGFDTIFWAQFNGNTNAGNCDWNTDTVTHLIVKRRNVDEFKWYTIATKEVQDISDFTIAGIDFMNRGGADYEYAVVPVFHGIEGAYSTTSVHSEFNGIFLVEKDKIIGTFITDAFCDTTRNTPGSFVETIHGKYPVSVDTTIANYDTGEFSGTFVSKSDKDGCTLEFDDDYIRTKYQKDIIDFLSNRKPKILKHFDGRIWLIKVNTGVSYSSDQIYNNRDISFNWTEIGDYNSEEDLFNTNLSDITEEWWNQ